MIENHQKVTAEPIGRTLLTMTIPMVLGTMGIVAFNLTDTFFVGRLGTRELAALSFTFPVVFTINSIALGLGIGVSSVVSLAAGSKNIIKVRELVTNGLIFSILLVVILSIAGMFSIDFLFSLLGATPQEMTFIKEYMMIWFPGMIFVVIPMVGNSALRGVGDTKTPAMIMLTSVFVNIALDPLLIFGWGIFPEMKLQGAALATVIARFCSMSLSLLFLIKIKRLVNFKFPELGNLYECWKEILYIGIPASATRIIIPLSSGVLTRIISTYGHQAVAAYGVATRIEFFALVSLVSLANVLAPVVGQNIGAGNIKRVYQAVKKSNIYAVLAGLVNCLMLFIFIPDIARIFNEDRIVVNNIVKYFRIVSFSYGLEGIFILATMVMNVIKKPFQSALISLIQMFIICIPLAMAGSHFLQVKGIYLSIAVSYFLGGLISVLILYKYLKDFFQNEFSPALKLN